MKEKEQKMNRTRAGKERGRRSCDKRKGYETKRKKTKGLGRHGQTGEESGGWEKKEKRERKEKKKKGKDANKTAQKTGEYRRERERKAGKKQREQVFFC